MTYNEFMDADEQITAEEAIAAILCDEFNLSEHEAQEASRKCLLEVINVFRPDLIEEE